MDESWGERTLDKSMTGTTMCNEIMRIYLGEGKVLTLYILWAFF